MLLYSAKEGSGRNFLTLLQWLFAKNWREIESLVPLADKFGMGIDTTSGFPEKAALSNMIFARLGTGEMCGKLAVFSWKYHYMTGVALKMAVQQNLGKCEYDHVRQIKYNYKLEKYAPYVVEDITEQHAMSKKHISHVGSLLHSSSRVFLSFGMGHKEWDL